MGVSRRHAPGVEMAGRARHWIQRGAAHATLTIGIALLMLVGALGVVGSSQAAALTLNTWSTVGSLHQARFGATATTLQNGDVLIAGGSSGSASSPVATASAELYSPATSAFATTGSMGTARFDAVAARLTNGDVLVAGGATGSGSSASATLSVEIYDASTGQFSAAQNLPTAIFGASAITLPTGEVLVVGGDTGTIGLPLPSSAAELYSQATNTWTSLPPLSQARAFASAIQLSDGDVLITGGLGSSGALSSSEVFQTDTSSWSSADAMPFASYEASSAVLPSGDVLYAGGTSSAGSAIANVATYSPSTNTWTATGSLLSARSDASAVALPDGNVLVAGGIGSAGSAIATAEIYDASTGKWTATAPLMTARADATATLISGGVVLIASGYDVGGSPLASVENYFAGIPPAFTSPSIVNFSMGNAQSFAIQTSGTPTPVVSEFGALPGGLSFGAGSANGSATISGQATGPAGSFTVKLEASNGVGTASERLTITIGESASPGYLVADASGSVFAYGLARNFSSLSVNPNARPVVAIASDAGTLGYYLVTKLGNVYNFGGARFYGSEAHSNLAAPVTAFATMPDGKGYWLALANGTVYSFGDASSYSSLSLNVRTNSLVAITPSVDGKGYWIVTARGNAYGYGDAHWYGSLARFGLSAPVTSFARTPDSRGYWIGLKNGAVFHFGDATAFSRTYLNTKVRPLVAILPTLDGEGLYLITAAGNVYGRGDALWRGSPVHVAHVGSFVSAAIPD